MKESHVQLDKRESGDLLHGTLPKASNAACILKICCEAEAGESQAGSVRPARFTQ